MVTPADTGEPMANESARQFEETILCHFDLLYRMAWKLTGNEHETEDLVQETLYRAQSGFATFDLREYGPRAWLLRIMRNIFYRQKDLLFKEHTLAEDLNLDDIAADIEQSPPASFELGLVDWDRFDQELRDAILALEPDYRLSIVLWALGGLNYQEIAIVMDCPIGTVMSRLYRARKRLSEELNDYMAQRPLIRSSKSVK